MFQRILILQKWEEAGLKNSKKKKVRDFIQFVEKNPQLGWVTCAKKFHKDYYDVFDDLIPPIMEIDDNLILLNLIDCCDPKKRRKELNLLKDLVTKTDPQKMQPSLEAVAKLKIPSLSKALRKKPNLPPQVNAILLEKQ